MNKFYQHGNKTSIIDLPPIETLFDLLPNNTYRFIAEESMMGINFYLEHTDNFKLPTTIYGDVDQCFKRIQTTFNNSKGNLGVLLVGQSGAGKTLQAKYVCENMRKTGLPVISVDKGAIHHLSYLAKNLKQPAVILVDEFEKQFDDTDDQNYLLTLLDGTYNSNLLFLFTANDETKVNPYFFDRPTRIKYVYKYKYLKEDVLKAIISDLLVNKTQEEEVLQLMFQTSNLSVDVLKSFIDECNLFPNENPSTLIEGFNITKGNVSLSSYFLELSVNGQSIEEVIKKHFQKVGIKFESLFVYTNNTTDESLTELKQSILENPSNLTYLHSNFSVKSLTGEPLNNSDYAHLRVRKILDTRFSYGNFTLKVAITNCFDELFMNLHQFDNLDHDTIEQAIINLHSEIELHGLTIKFNNIY